MSYLSHELAVNGTFHILFMFSTSHGLLNHLAMQNPQEPVGHMPVKSVEELESYSSKLSRDVNKAQSIFIYYILNPRHLK